MVRSHHPSVMMKAPMPILFHGKFRDVDWRRSGTVRPTTASFCEPNVDPLCSDEEALRDRFWETCLNRLKAQLFPLGVF